MPDFYQATLGSTLQVSLDLTSIMEPLEGLAPGYPRVDLQEDGDVLQSVLASVSTPVTNYDASINIPLALDLTNVDFKNLQVVWRIRSVSGRSYKASQIVQVVAPENRRQIQGELVYVAGGQSQDISVLLDFSLDTGSDPPPLLDIYHGNTALQTGVVCTSFANRGETSVANFNITGYDLAPRLLEYNLIVRGTRNSVPYTKYVALYIINPSILAAIEHIKQQLMKARLDNVISALNYTERNIVGYLQRGLDLFNMYPPATTSFTGTNMMGGIRNCWLHCSMYYALCAQYLAENDLDFDFSGQSVTLRVDRKSGISDAIQRASDELDRLVRPYKQLLAKAGATTGDGSGDGLGGVVVNPSAMGSVSTGNHTMLNLNQRGNTTARFFLNGPFRR